jgi:DNA-binding transcriptional LysR family regulator
VDLNEMAAFVRVVARGSFAAAAKELGVPPSTLSRRVSSLERRLGASLLTRTTRSLRTTEAGAAFFERCAPAVAQAEQAEQVVRSLAAAPRGTLRITAPSVFLHSLLIPTVTEYLRLHREVRVELAADDRTVDLVREGYDLAFRVAPALPDTSLVARKLGAPGHLLCASPRYLAHRAAPRAPSDLRDHAICAFGRERSSVAWSFWQKGRVVERVRLTPRLLTSSEDALHAFCREGIGVALLPHGLGDQDLLDGRLQRVLGSYDVEPRNLYLVMPREKQGAPAVRAYLDVVAAFVRSHPRVFGGLNP